MIFLLKTLDSERVPPREKYMFICQAKACIMIVRFVLRCLLLFLCIRMRRETGEDASLQRSHTHTYTMPKHACTAQPVVVVIMEKEGEEKTYRTGIIPNETFLDVVS